MGYCIQTESNHNKHKQLEAIGAELIGGPPNEFSAIPPDKALICVVQNGPFDAAGLCYSDSELLAFSNPEDHRPKHWLLMDRTQAHELAGYKGN